MLKLFPKFIIQNVYLQFKYNTFYRRSKLYNIIVFKEINQLVHCRLFFGFLVIVEESTYKLMK